MSAVFDCEPPVAGPTPYEGHRRRLILSERLEAARGGLSIEGARRLVARRVRLTPDQIVNIRKRKRKDLYGDLKERIDATFVALARRVVRDLEEEMAAVAASPRGVDPGALAGAEAARDALTALIAEARAPTGGDEA